MLSRPGHVISQRWSRLPGTSSNGWVLATRRKCDDPVAIKEALESSRIMRKRWFAVAARLFLAAVFILYGILKLLGLQLSVTASSISEMRVGDVSPFLITWYFFSLSPLYHHAIGIAQIATGLLLVFERTAAVGALCFFVIILNIVLINFGYNIATDAKILSLVLITLDCFLITYYWRRYRLLLLPEAALNELSEPRKGGKASTDRLTNVRLVASAQNASEKR
jgi:uncharacterized membrane protein YphA (DoxX/SURF4 family)